MTELEEQLVDALRRQAERRPDGAAVREALARTGSRRRGRTVVIALAAAAVVTIAITVPLVLTRGDAATSAAAIPANQPPFWQQAMAYEPGWLPDEVVESERMADSRSVLRNWRMPPGSQWPGPDVHLAVYNSDEPLPRNDDMTVVDVHGVPATVHSEDLPTGHHTEVYWQPRPHIQVQLGVQGGLHHRDLALRIARALRSDGTKQFRPLIELGWCPFDDQGVTTTGPTVGGHDPQGMATCTRKAPSTAEVAVFLDKEPSITKGTKVTVRGRQGLYSKSGAEQNLSVRLDNGQYLNVRGSGVGRPPTEPDMVKVADAVVVHDPTYLNWLYAR